MYGVKNTCNKLHKVVFFIKLQAKKHNFEHFCAIQLIIITTFLPILFAHSLTVCTLHCSMNKCPTSLQLFYVYIMVDCGIFLVAAIILKLCQIMFFYFLPSNLSRALPAQQPLSILYSH